MSIMREPIVGGELLPDGTRRLILGWDTFSPEQLERIKTESAIMQAKIICLERGILTGDELSNFDWTVLEQPMTHQDHEAIARQSDATAERGLGPCRHCHRPTVRAAVNGVIRHMDPSGNPSWRTCRAASKEWIHREFGVRRPTWDDSLDPHWVASPSDNRTYPRAALVSQPPSNGAGAATGNDGKGVGQEMITVVTRTPLAEGIR